MAKWKLVNSMQPIVESWRAHMEEELDKFPYQLYVDLDGVLVDFKKGATQAINVDLKDPGGVPERLKKEYDKMVRALENAGRGPRSEESWKISPADFDKKSPHRINAVRNYMYPRLEDDLQFWAELDWIEPDGRVLWEIVKDIHPPPFILTSPMHGHGSHEGKQMWVQKNLGIDKSRVIVERDKYKYAIADTGAQNVLIDDTYEKIHGWENGPGDESAYHGGGIGILHTSTQDTLDQLEGLKRGSDIPEEPIA